MQTRPHRADGTADHVGGFHIGQLLQVAEHDDLTVRDRQVPQGPPDRVDLSVTGEAGDRIGLDGQRLPDPGLGIGQRIEATIAPEPAPGLVPRNPEQPRQHTRSTGLVPMPVLR